MNITALLKSFPKMKAKADRKLHNEDVRNPESILFIDDRCIQ